METVNLSVNILKVLWKMMKEMGSSWMGREDKRY